MIRPGVAAVSFDVDGTLYTREQVRLRFVMANLFRMRAARVALRVREELRARAFEDGAALLAEEARLVGERLDVGPEEARRLVGAILDDGLSAILRRTGPVRGARDAILQVAGAGLKIAVVSDRRIDDKLDALGLADLPFAARVSAEETGKLKPHPGGLLVCAERLGVRPDEIVHVGDRPETDGEAALRAGAQVVLVGGAADLAGAHAVDGLPAAAALILSAASAVG